MAAQYAHPQVRIPHYNIAQVSSVDLLEQQAAILNLGFRDVLIDRAFNYIHDDGHSGCVTYHLSCSKSRRMGDLDLLITTVFPGASWMYGAEGVQVQKFWSDPCVG
jgi:hypothetical protein